MVLYYTSNVTNPPGMIYMGKDKFENEDLIKYGFPEDFHVDKMSSAHVYVRLERDQSWTNIPEPLLNDCAQLVKANSIEGNKCNNITIIYTPWSNLKKTPGMETGQVGFFDNKMVKRVYVKTRVNEIVNRLNKTKVEKVDVDLQKQKAEREKNDRLEARKEQFARDEEIREVSEQTRKAREEFKALFATENMTSNRQQYQSVEEAEDDFM